MRHHALLKGASMATYLVTGVAGFIGAALSERLLKEGHMVYGFDNLNDYYDVSLKKERVARLQNMSDRFTFEKIDLADMPKLSQFIEKAQPEYILHVGAQASVRYALNNPRAYLNSNLIGHFNILEIARKLTDEGVLQHMVYASTSSVYGGNEKVPFEETDDVSKPQSLYAATKYADELMTYSYCNMFGLTATAVRFFTVYGPWGRPDMSPMIFGSAILDSRSIPLFNKGDLWRDFTYIDDIVEGVLRLSKHLPKGKVKHNLYNMGNCNPIQMLKFVEIMEEIFGKKAKLDLQDWPPTEVYKTFADTAKLEAAIGWTPSTDLKTGLVHFAEWFVPYYEARKAVA